MVFPGSNGSNNISYTETKSYLHRQKGEKCNRLRKNLLNIAENSTQTRLKCFFPSFLSLTSEEVSQN